MLEIEKINVFYNDFHVLHDLSLKVNHGELVGLVGANGHGKSTLLKAICGLVPIRSGRIEFNCEDIKGLEAPDLVERGVVYVAEERNLFLDMTVKENLELGAYLPLAQKKMAENMEMVFDLYPRLAERHNQIAKTLSGGEAQMLALGRGLMSSAEFMAIDEPSLGLAPNLVHEMFQTIKKVNSQGVAILIVEQNLAQLNGVMKRVYKLEEGQIVGQHSETVCNHS
jgi:branched-chain amino acid transport system ATP-binding protein